MHVASRRAGSGSSKSSRTEHTRVRKMPERIGDLYGDGHTGNLLKGEYQTPAVYAWFQKRHRAAHKFLDDDGFYRRNGCEWKAPYGVRHCMSQPLLWSQIASKYP